MKAPWRLNMIAWGRWRKTCALGNLRGTKLGWTVVASRSLEWIATDRELRVWRAVGDAGRTRGEGSYNISIPSLDFEEQYLCALGVLGTADMASSGSPFSAIEVEGSYNTRYFHKYIHTFCCGAYTLFQCIIRSNHAHSTINSPAPGDLMFELPCSQGFNMFELPRG